MSIYRLIATAVLAAGLLAGCGDDNDDQKKPNPQVEENLAPVVAIVAQPSVEVGATVELDASLSSDPDGDAITLTWALVAPEGSEATLAATTGVTNSFVADVAGTYAVTVTADDGKLTTTRTVEIEATTDVVENEAPIAAAGEDVTVVVGTAVTLDGTASSDPEGATLTYAWTFVSVPEGSEAAFDEAGAPEPTFTPDVAGAYTIALVVNDGELDSAADEVVVTATEVANNAPVVDAGEDATGNIGETVTLTGTATDADEDELTLAWTLTAPEGSDAVLSAESLATTSFVPDVPGSYELTFSADDGTVSVSDSVTITVANRLPVVDAGANKSGFTGTAVALAGTATDDDGHELTWSWTVTDAPTGADTELTGADTATPALLADLAGTYEITASVTDGFDTVTDTVQVVLADPSTNVAPVANAGTDIFANLGETVQLDGTASVDPDGTAITYQWTIVEPADTTVTFDDATLAQPSFVPDVAGEWEIKLVVSDGLLTDEDTVLVTVNTPPTANAGADQTVTVGDTVTLDGTASSDADNDSIDFTWAFVSGPETITFTDASQPTQTFVAGMEGVYVFELSVADADAVSSDTVTITAQATTTPTTCLIISEYVEGSSFNKAIELFNCGTTTIDLSNYTLCLGVNGASACGNLTTLSGTLLAGEVFVACHGSIADPGASACDMTNNNLINFNGDDGIQLKHTDGTVIDVFGVFTGTDPGSPWADMTLRRECSWTPYTDITTAAFADPAVWGQYYKQYASNEMSDLGIAPATSSCPAAP